MYGELVASLSKFYIKNGIFNANQLKNVSNNWIKKNSNVLSSRTAMELRGILVFLWKLLNQKEKVVVYQDHLVKK